MCFRWLFRDRERERERNIDWLHPIYTPTGDMFPLIFRERGSVGERETSVWERNIEPSLPKRAPAGGAPWPGMEPAAPRLLVRDGTPTNLAVLLGLHFFI